MLIKGEFKSLEERFGRGLPGCFGFAIIQPSCTIKEISRFIRGTVMKPSYKFLVILGLMFSTLIFSGCGLTDLVGNRTATPAATEETQQASPQPTGEDGKTGTEAPPTGAITGLASYPSEFIPPQRVIAFNQEDFSDYYVVEMSSGGEFQLDVPPGVYVVLAYPMNPSALGMAPGLAGAYTEAVLCGLQYGCDDHSLVSVTVAAGEATTEINPGDWYLPQGEDAGWPPDPLQPTTGNISGGLGYPSEYIPAMRVVAFELFSDAFYFVDTGLNQTSYELEELPVGTYQVVAFILDQGPDMAGGYTYFVTCGMTAECTNHRLQDVFVYPGETTVGIDPVDFYAPPAENDWPEYPGD